jgi:hypothetical protein
MIAGEIRSRQYAAACPKCRGVRTLSRGEVQTGRHPLCEHDGESMVVYGGRDGRPPDLALEAAE